MGRMTDEDTGIFVLDAPRKLREEYRRGHGRLTDLVAFELPMSSRGVDLQLEAEGEPYDPDATVLGESLEPELLAIVRAEVSADAAPRLVAADSGRGASGYAVALELQGYIADFGGTVAFGVLAWQQVKRLYDRLTARMGRPPLVSLGAATYLAAADLAGRLGTPDFVLHGATDARSNPPDRSYTGDDNFVVIFERDRRLHTYLVDARGRAHYFGSVQMRGQMDEPGEI